LAGGKLSHIYIPARSADDWREFLAEPDRHWRKGYSARAAAFAWQEADGFPREVAALLSSANDDNLKHVELLLAIPEHRVYFPPIQGHPSQNDVFALGRALNGDLVSIAVEAKVAEPFDLTVDEWIAHPTRGKLARLQFLRETLRVVSRPIGQIRYQLLHRLASALLEAKRFGARYAILVIHSFSQSDEWFDDFAAFLSMYGQAAAVGQLVELDLRTAMKVFAGWARGDAKYLDA
jgi:hypothetical protein